MQPLTNMFIFMEFSYNIHIYYLLHIIFIIHLLFIIIYVNYSGTSDNEPLSKAVTSNHRRVKNDSCCFLSQSLIQKHPRNNRLHQEPCRRPYFVGPMGNANSINGHIGDFLRNFDEVC